MHYPVLAHHLKYIEVFSFTVTKSGTFHHLMNIWNVAYEKKI